MAALPLLQKAKVPLIAPLTGSAALRDPKLAQTVFNLRASYADETALMVKQLVSLGLKKIAVFYQNDAYGQSGLDGVTQALQSQGLKPVGAATVERNSEDVSKAIKTLVPLGADVIVQVGTYAASAAFVRAARQAGYRVARKLRINAAEQISATSSHCRSDGRLLMKYTSELITC